MCPEFLTFKGYIDFLLFNVADSPSFNINSSLPDIDMLLRPRFCRTAIPTASPAAYFDTPI